MEVRLPPEEPSIFRKKSLEHLSNPEQLDTIMKVTTPKGWIALASCAFIIFLALIWALFGKIPTTLTGSGMLLRTGGVYTVEARGEGQIKEILVRVGDNVTVGQIVATVDQQNLHLLVEQTRNKLKNLETERATKKQALDLGLISQDAYNQVHNQYQFTEVDLRMALINQQQGSNVQTPYEGRIMDVQDEPGAMIKKGATIVTLEITKRPLTGIIFVPQGGKRVEKDMTVQLSPSNVTQEEYGYLMGKVTSVGLIPASPESMMAILHDQKLVEQLSKEFSPFLVDVGLEQDESTISGYRWSTKKGPPFSIDSGTPCTARIVVREQRPISLVIPLLKKQLGVH